MTMELNKMGYENLLKTAEKLNSQIEYIKECIEEAGCWYISTDEEDKAIMVFTLSLIHDFFYMILII